MMIELPIVYALNFDEVEKAKEQGIDIEVTEGLTMTTFIIPKECLIRINESTEQSRTTIYFDDISYLIESDYETVLEIFKRELK